MKTDAENLNSHIDVIIRNSNYKNMKKPPIDSKKNPSLLIYVFVLAIILAAAFSQYFFHEKGMVRGFLVVYGIPIASISFFYGRKIISRAFSNNRSATRYGLAFWGIFSVISFFLGFLIFYGLDILNPQATQSLDKPVPVLETSPEMAWVMVFASIIIVGPAEEYIFRGFVFGRLLEIMKNRHWFFMAVFSSLLFAAAHLYYVLTYGISSSIFFVDIISIGIAMSAAYYYSGGNLVFPSLFHGIYDATGFLGVATGSNIGDISRNILVAIGLVAATLFIAKKTGLNKYFSSA